MIPKDGRRGWKSLNWTQKTPLRSQPEMYVAATRKHTKTKMLRRKRRRRTRNSVMVGSRMGHYNNLANSSGHAGVVLVRAGSLRWFPRSHQYSCRPFDNMGLIQERIFRRRGHARIEPWRWLKFRTGIWEEKRISCKAGRRSGI